MNNKYALLFTTIDRERNVIKLPRSLSYQLYESKDTAKEERTKYLECFKNNPVNRYQIEIVEIPENWFKKRRR